MHPLCCLAYALECINFQMEITNLEIRTIPCLDLNSYEQKSWSPILFYSFLSHCISKSAEGSDFELCPESILFLQVY